MERPFSLIQCVNFRGRRSTIVTEASRGNNACSSSIVGDEVHISNIFPANTVRFHPTDKPWITARIKQLVKERQQAFHAGDAQLWRLYRCKVQSEIKARKRKLYEEKVRNTWKDDVRQWWRTVNVMSGRTYSQSCFTLEARRRCPVGRRTCRVSKSVLRNRSCCYSTT